MSSTCNSILWIYIHSHSGPTNDLYICVVYAVQSGGSADKKLSFWKELNGSTSNLQQLPGHRILVGDFNARLGSITGDHTTNSNKKYLLDFIHDHSLINMNSIRTFGEYTFHNIKNGNRSIIDYLLTDMMEFKIPEHIILSGSLGTSAQTAHKAIFSKIALKVMEARANTIQVGPRWRSVNVKNVERFHKSLKEELAMLIDGACDYKTIVSAINRAKTNSLGRVRPRPKFAVYDTPELDRLHVDLGTALEEYRLEPNLNNLKKSSSLENKIRKANTQRQKKTLLDFLNKLESLDQISKMRLFYARIRKKTNSIIDPFFVIWDPNSIRETPNFSSTNVEYLDFWVKYLKKTFVNNSIVTFTPPENPTIIMKQDSPLKMEEVRSAIIMLKNRKAAGVDMISNEDIKLIESLRPGLIFCTLQKMWIEERCPDDFRKALIHLLPKPQKPGKEKDLRFQKKHRPISLLATIRKFYESVISIRVLKSVNLQKSQFGFLTGRTTVDCIFLLREAILEARYVREGKKGGRNQKLYAAFIDIKGAFDEVQRGIMWQKLSERFGIRGKLLRVIMDLFRNIKGKAILNSMTTRWFSISSGIMQGSVLGPTLFLLFIDDLLEKLHKTKVGIAFDNLVLPTIAYADDITLITPIVSELDKLLDVCNTWAVNNGMEFSISKCFVVVFNSISKKPNDLPIFTLGSYRLKSFYPENVKGLFLGFNITDRVARTKLNQTSSHPLSLVPHFRSKPNQKYLKLVKAKINRSRFGVHRLCLDRNILTPRISIRIFKTLQRSTLLYCIEVCDWDLDQVEELKILQAKAIRSHFDLDLQCPKATLRSITGVEPFQARIDFHVLLFDLKLCHSNLDTILGKFHKYRSSNLNALPVGFYFTAYTTLNKIGLDHLWDNMPINSEIKSLLKKHIWQYYWKRDVAKAIQSKSLFSSVFLRNTSLPVYPYKIHKFMIRLNTKVFPRIALAAVLRFWLTPNRKRTCSYNAVTSNLANHLLFSCPKTRKLIATYLQTLNPELVACLLPDTLLQFLSYISSDEKLLEDFNHIIGMFDYPLY